MFHAPTAREWTLTAATGKRAESPQNADAAGAPGQVTDVQSEMDPRFSSGLLQVLDLIREGRVGMFFADSFKLVTRNPHKLRRAIDFVRAHGVMFLTHNYLLGPTYVARRQTLWAPVHHAADSLAKFAHRAGLTRAHREALEAMEEDLLP